MGMFMAIKPAKRGVRLSKSRILSGLQCEKRLWFDVHRPELAEESADMRARFGIGDSVTIAARNLHPGGILIDGADLNANLAQTAGLISDRSGTPLFEATFAHEGVLVRTDVLTFHRRSCHLTEVKAGTSIRDPNYHDCAIQTWVLSGAGLDVHKVNLAHINNQFVYAGDGNYEDLFVVNDVTEDVRPMLREVPRWARKFISVVDGKEPDITVGEHCTTPYECPYLAHCRGRESEFPVRWLPGRKAVVRELIEEGIDDIRRIPAGRLKNEKQEWVRRVTVSGKAELHKEPLAVLRDLPWPRYYFDFETVSFAVPVWADTSPYEQLVFQWSCHIENSEGTLAHKEFLPMSAGPPMRAAAETLIATLGTTGPIIVYGSFEATQLRELQSRFPDLAGDIEAIVARIVNLLPITQAAYYHPDMGGSWSIKAVLPTISSLDYSALGEVQDGGVAGTAWLEMIHPDTTEERRAKLEADLRAYCRQDTLGLVELMRFFTKT